MFLILLLSLASASVVVIDVDSNTQFPGDAFSGVANAFQPLGSSGLVYTNVRDNAIIGINTNIASPSGALPRASVSLRSTTSAAKADLEYYGALGALSQLTGASYAWYRRGGTSTVASHLVPSFRLLIDVDGEAGTTADRLYLIYEPIYNGYAGPAATDAWSTHPIGPTTILWPSGSLYTLNFTTTLTAWKTLLPNAAVIAISSGVGSGWAGTFDGAIDNLSWTFGTTETQLRTFVVGLIDPTE